MKHTEEKWHIEIGINGAVIYEPDTGTIANIPIDLIKWKANAQRIVDCVNGCVGIENPLAVGELLEACKDTLNIINSYSHIPAQFEACQMLQQAINKVEEV